MDLANMSDGTQRQKDKYHMPLLILNIWNGYTNMKMRIGILLGK